MLTSAKAVLTVINLCYVYGCQIMCCCHPSLLLFASKRLKNIALLKLCISPMHSHCI